MAGIDIRHGDCMEVMRTLPDCSVDSIVTDPPYGLAFMGKRWDYDVPSVEVWQECLRVLKPGGHLLAFAGTRTQHRMAVRIEDAGFEIRDMIAWVYGSGFPKSLDVSKAIDRAAGHERATEYEPNYKNGTFGKGMGGGKHGAQSEPPVTPEAQQWAGWGTALKPALEPITMARKPLIGTVAENVLTHSTGAINVDGCRVGTECTIRTSNAGTNGDGLGMGTVAHINGSSFGRWPANLIHDGSEEVMELFPQTQPSKQTTGTRAGKDAEVFGKFAGQSDIVMGYDDNGGSAARFFYCPKADQSERGDGNNHPTVKPVDLMRYLVRLVTREGGTVLEPFGGSGTTAVACVHESCNCIIIERESQYVEIIKQRIAKATQQQRLF